MSARPTPGPWSAHSCDAVPTDDDNGVRFVDIFAGDVYKSFNATGALSGYYAGGKHVASVWRFGDCIEQRDANAALIAEAGTVYHDTGLMPRELADQRAELLAALEGVIDILGLAESNASGTPTFDYVGPRVAKVRALMAKCKAGAA